MLVLLAFASAGHAQQPRRTHRDAAVALGDEGLTLLDQGDYRGALAKFDAANSLVAAPTFGVRAALCLEYLGRLVEALKRYERVAAMQVDPSWPAIHTKAQEEARQRAVELRKRVARVYVILRGTDPERASIELDGRDLDYASVASAVLVDPGEHTLEVAYGGAVQRRAFRMRERDQHQEIFVLEQTGQDEPQQPSSTQRTVGWVGVGLGAAGVAVGAVSGLVALGKKGDLEARCPDRVCPPDAWADNDAYYKWRNTSTLGFALGGLALGVGTLLIVTAPGDVRESGHARVEPWVGLGSAGVRGGF